MLTAERLSIAVPSRTLVRALSVSFSPGENWAVLGPNGSGKSLLLKTLAGLRAAAGGEVRLAGRPMAALPARSRAQQLAILLQEHEPPFPTTVLETVLAGRSPRLPAWRWETPADLAAAEAALAAVGLAAFGGRLLDTLSGGELRRAAIAMVLAQDAPVCLWDEPTNHLDLHQQVAVMALLAARARRLGHLNVFVLHDVNLACRYCTHALLLTGDGEACFGEIGKIISAEMLGKIYGCAVRAVQGPEGPIYLPA